MVRFALTALTVLSLTQMAHADVQIFKILDGSVAYCDSSRTNVRPNDKVVGLSMIDERSSEDSQETTLRVSMMKCAGGVWMNDEQPSYEKYTAPNGAVVEVTYDNYELLLVNKNYDILLQTELEHLNRSSIHDQSVSIVKTRQSPQDLEVLIRVRKHVKADNGVEFSETVTFGGFRVRLN